MIVVTEDQVAELVDEIGEKLNALDAARNLTTSATRPTPPSGVTHLWLEPVGGGRFKLKAVTGV